MKSTPKVRQLSGAWGAILAGTQMLAVSLAPVTIVTNTAHADDAWGGSLFGAFVVGRQFNAGLERAERGGSARFNQHQEPLENITIIRNGLELRPLGYPCL